VTPEERRAFYKKEGILPPVQYNETPFFLASTGTVFDAYVPPEGDGRSSLLSKEVKNLLFVFNKKSNESIEFI
jgi:hypothetical protein